MERGVRVGDWKVNRGMKRIALVILAVAQMTWAQSEGLKVGENTHLNAGGLVDFGYSGDYGDDIASSHGLNVGASGTLSGFYYNPNFLNFSATPYYNQSRADSSSQSLTDATGIAGIANFFTGSHFPGSVSYHYDHNSSGTFGLPGTPNFTTVGTGQGFGIAWSALIPDWPTFSIGYSQGSGSGTVYGTNEETGSSTHNLNLRSTYVLKGFRLNGYFDHMSFNSNFPEFLAGNEMAVSDTSGHDFGFGTNHSLPANGNFYVNYNRSSFTTVAGMGQELPSNTSSWTTGTEYAGASFYPTVKLGLFVSQTYTDNLSGSLVQGLVSSGAVPPPINLGSTSNGFTFAGGASYQFTKYISGIAQATHFEQNFLGNSYSGTFVSGSVNCARRLLDTFSFSASVVDSDNGQGNNTLGFVGTVNYFRRFGRWDTSGTLSYAQNVQTALVTYTTSYYQYRASVLRPFGHGLQWSAAFNGTKSALTQQPNSPNHSEGYSTTMSGRRFSLNANYNTFYGVGVLSTTGIVPVPPIVGVLESGLTVYNGSSYGGGVTITPLPRLMLSGDYSRAISNTISNTISGQTPSHNDTEIFNAQMQYHLRKINMLAGYTRFTQGISAFGALPGSVNSYFIGVSRWVNLY